MHCGYMDESEWQTSVKGDGNPSVPTQIGWTPDAPGVEWRKEDPETGQSFPNVCPGWAVRQPLVIEICQAHKAFDKGALSSLFPDISNAVAEGVQELSRAFDEFQRQRMAEMSRRAERG